MGRGRDNVIGSMRGEGRGERGRREEGKYAKEEGGAKGVEDGEGRKNGNMRMGACCDTGTTFGRIAEAHVNAALWEVCSLVVWTGFLAIRWGVKTW